MVFLIVFLSPKQSKNEVDLCIIHGKANGSSFTWRIQALELRSPLPKPNQGCKKEKQRNLTRNSRGQQLLDTFRVLPGVHFMHTICRFEAREVRSPTLQIMHESKLQWRSYGRLKTTVSSCVKISQLRNELRKFRSPKPISQLQNELWNAPLAHKRHFAAPYSHFAAAKWPAKMPLGCEIEPRCEITSKLRMKLQIISKLRNHLQVVKSQVQIAKSKFKLGKWTIQRAKSTCAISDIYYRLS